MIFIVVKTKVKSGAAEAYIDARRPFLEATRGEPGNKWFDYYRSVEDPDTVLLLEAFDDEEAGEFHVNSEHFKGAVESDDTKDLVIGIPDIIYVNLADKDGWDKLAEF